MQQSYDISQMPKIEGAKITILQSKWYRQHTDSMARRCSDILKEAGAKVDIQIVPGCYEFALCAQSLLRREKELEAIICIGVLMKGETDHYEMILQSCVVGMQQVSLEQETPLINAILPVTKIEQVIARTLDNDANKGIEAALAAGEMIVWRRKLSGQTS